MEENMYFILLRQHMRNRDVGGKDGDRLEAETVRTFQLSDLLPVALSFLHGVSSQPLDC